MSWALSEAPATTLPNTEKRSGRPFNAWTASWFFWLTSRLLTKTVKYNVLETWLTTGDRNL